MKYNQYKISNNNLIYIHLKKNLLYYRITQNLNYSEDP